MRKHILLASSFILSSVFSLSALAQDNSTTMSDTTAAPAAATQPAAGGAMMPKHHHHEHSGPCSRVFAACKAAGFGKDAGPGKSMWRNCVKPTLMGSSVTGVTVDPNDAQACKTRMAEKMRKQAAELNGSAPAQAMPAAPATTPAQ